MRYGIAVLAALLAATAAPAQDRGANSAPFTGYEAQAISDVWSEIRQAPAWDKIDWVAAGLNRAPGSPETQQLMAAHWSELRRAEYFGRIDWDEVVNGDRGRRAKRSDRRRSDDRLAEQFADANAGNDVGPFTSEEAAIVSRVWPRIREAADYEDIDWRALGIREPGDRDARRVMAAYWGRLREAERFEDIKWTTTVASRRTSD
jgi:hypothetical protein